MKGGIQEERRRLTGQKPRLVALSERGLVKGGRRACLQAAGRKSRRMERIKIGEGVIQQSRGGDGGRERTQKVGKDQGCPYFPSHRKEMKPIETQSSPCDPATGQVAVQQISDRSLKIIKKHFAKFLPVFLICFSTKTSSFN